MASYVGKVGRSEPDPLTLAEPGSGNGGPLPPELFEAEVFGHTRGAFTGARQSKRGLIEVADGDTLFLDEIGDLPPTVQSKILNSLESRRFRHVGSTEEIPVDLRLITATNRDLDERVRDGRFREGNNILACTNCANLLGVTGQWERE